MGRLPFDPAKMAGSQPPATPPSTGESAPLSVSQLAARVGAALDVGLPARMKVIGQVSGFRERTHWYFDLKDGAAVVSCVVFASAARKVGFKVTDGQEVVLSGRVEFYAPGGKVSFIADRVEPVGAGAMELAFRRLCEELKALGWFADERKRPIPMVPRRIAVVTSRTGAALQDVLDTARRRCAAVDIVVVDTRVQGEGAAAEIAKAIRAVGAAHARLGIDVLLLTRGGGSVEDLWAFNDRIVAQAIIESPIPVVAAIGHETDTTIAELVADVRGATPTQAAMRAVPDAAALDRQAQSLVKRLHVIVDRDVRVLKGRLHSTTRHAMFADPRMVVAEGRDRLDGVQRAMRSAMQVRVSRESSGLSRVGGRLEMLRPASLHAAMSSRVTVMAARLAQAGAGLGVDLHPVEKSLARALAGAARDAVRRVEAAERQLQAVGPLSVLRRGFSVTLDARGRVVRASSDVRPGDRLKTRVAEGEIDSVVDGREVTARPRPGRPAAPGSGQIDLF